MRFLLALSISLLATNLSIAHDSSAIAPKEAHTHVAQVVSVHGFVGEVIPAINGDLVIHFGRPDPNHPFEAIVPQKSVPTIGQAAQNLAGKEATIRGTIVMDKEKARIIVTSAEQILK